MIHSYKEHLATAAVKWRKGNDLGKIVAKGKPETLESKQQKGVYETMQSLVTPLMHLRTLRILLSIRTKTD